VAVATAAGLLLAALAVLGAMVAAAAEEAAVHQLMETAAMAAMVLPVSPLGKDFDMENYAVIKDKIVINVIVADCNFAKANGLVLLTDNAGIGWSYINGKFIDGRVYFESETESNLTEEELLARLQALQAQITALE